jgi:hypothetical protein
VHFARIEEATMERLVITIRPATSGEKLSVEDALEQVLDLIHLHDEMGQSEDASPFVWRLEKASTNSPFVITAVAEPTDPQIDVAPAVLRIKQRVAVGLRELGKGERPSWSPDAFDIAQKFLARNRNGIATTEVDFGASMPSVTVDKPLAERGTTTLDAMNVAMVDAEIGGHTAVGELRGVFIAAGRYLGKPAIQMRTLQYGFVWSILAKREDPIAAAKIAEVWEGKTVAVEGRLCYGPGGKLKFVDRCTVHLMDEVAPVDLDSVVDPSFTAGLDPAEYVKRLHEGTLAQ